MWELMPYLYEYRPNHFINLKEIIDIRPTTNEVNKFWYLVGSSVHTLTKEEHDKLIQTLRNGLKEV